MSPMSIALLAIVSSRISEATDVAKKNKPAKFAGIA